METGSNWTRRLWPLRASQAAANTRSVHISHPPPFGRVRRLWLSALYCSLAEEYEFFWGGVFKAPGTSPPGTAAHLTCSSKSLTVVIPRPEQKSNFILILSLMLSLPLPCCFPLCLTGPLLLCLSQHIFTWLCFPPPTMNLTEFLILEPGYSFSCSPDSLWRPGWYHTWGGEVLETKADGWKTQRENNL